MFKKLPFAVVLLFSASIAANDSTTPVTGTLTLADNYQSSSGGGIESRIFIVAKGSKNLGRWQQCSLAGTSDPSATWRSTSVSRSGPTDSRGFSDWVVKVDGPGSGSYGASVTCWKMK